MSHELDPSQIWETQVLAHDRDVVCCRFSPCGRYVFGGGYDGQVQRWDLETGEKISLPGHDGWLTAIAFDPSGKRFYSADTWGQVRAWDFTQDPPAIVWSMEAAHTQWVRSLAISPDGRWIATCGNDCLVKLWSAADGKLVCELPGHTHHVYSLAFHPDGASLASGDLLGVVNHWDLAQHRLVRDLEVKVLHTRVAQDTVDAGGVRSLAFNRAGTRLACGGITNYRTSIVGGIPGVVLLDWNTGQQERILRPKDAENEYKVHGIFVESLLYHPAGFLIGVGGNGERAGAMWFWDEQEVEPLFELNKIEGSRCIDLHPDATRIAVAQFQENGRGKNGGNGRKATDEEYHSHDGTVRIYCLAAKSDSMASTTG